MSALAGRRPADAALVYARRGWEVLPCHSPLRNREGCSCRTPDCGSPGKHPRIAGGLRSASRDEDVVRGWWESWPAANVGVRTGAASGIVVVDVDPDHGGDTSLARLVERRGPLPAGRTVRTGGGGRHLYFAHPGCAIPNDAGRRLGPGLDIRGDGGYVVAPPSRHTTGGLYSVAARGGELPELPSWLLDLMRPQVRPVTLRTPPAASSRAGVGSAWARRALEGEVRRLAQAEPGERNDTLNRAAYRLGQIAGVGLLDGDATEEALIGTAVSVGLSAREARGTARSGLSAGQRLPRGPASAWDPPEMAGVEVDAGHDLAAG